MINVPRPATSFFNSASDQKLDGGTVWERGYRGLTIILHCCSPSLTLQGENDIDQLCCVLRVLGTPNERIWPVSIDTYT